MSNVHNLLQVQQEPMFFTHLGASRPTSDALFPNFLKPSGGMSKNIMRDAKKDGRSIIPGTFFNINLHPKVLIKPYINVMSLPNCTMCSFVEPIYITKGRSVVLSVNKPTCNCR